jgi:CRISPR-associated exonuclease Cas4
MTWLILASLAILALALLLRSYARARAENLGLAGELVYRDGGDREELFVSKTHGLAGRPDYILKTGGAMVPVERKSRNVSAAGPHEGELLQLAAYCLLVEERFGKPVVHGCLQYLNRSVEIPFDAPLRSKLLATLRAMRQAEAARDVARSHNSPSRCRGCGFRQVCKQSLTS